MAGLSPDNIRLGPQSVRMPDDGIIVDVQDKADEPQIDTDGAILSIEHGDGAVTISLDGKPLEEADKPDDTGWFANLADKIGDTELGKIANDLLRGIDDDIQSRKEWIEARTTGIQLLGLKIEVPGLQGASDGAPVEGMSKVRDSLLLETCLRFQANARSELLPTDGPVKVRDDGDGSPADDASANALEKDMNHYLTAVDRAYYPDTDRMLLMLGFGGTAFKKVYFHPIKMRPVSESVDAEDLIVNSSAVDLGDALRVTHKLMMRPSVVKRMQILGVYRDVDLMTPAPPKLDSVEREKASQQGVQPDASNPEDRNREIYECYCELDIPGFEHRWKGKQSGLPLPYRVTLDVTSQQVLSIVRNFNDVKGELPRARKTFVKYTYVPGLGFYDIGLLHILGNTTNAITAAVREMLDNGMYANFPGVLISKQASRQNTNILRVPPGGAAQIDTQGMSMRDAVMPLPYNTQQMAPLMALIQAMKQDGQRIGGTSELQVGEGRPDAPVGTTLAMIDQATKVENSVHKRLHAAQAEEFKLLVQCFREHPDSFFEQDCPSKTPWTEQTFIAALDNCNLVPQADPNTSSHGQRMMKVMALLQLAATQPGLYDPLKIHTTALQAIGWSNPESFFAPPSAQAQPPPELQEIQAGIQTAKQIADAKTTEAQAKMAQANAKMEEAKAKGLAAAGSGQQQPNPLDAMVAQAKLMDAQTNRLAIHQKEQDTQVNSQDEAKDRASKEHLAHMDLLANILAHPQEAALGANEAPGIERKIGE